VEDGNVKICLAICLASVAAASLGFAASADALGAGDSISGKLLLVGYPGVPLAETFSADAAHPQPVPEPRFRTEAMDTVTIPGIAPRNVFADRLHWVLGLATVVAGGVTGLVGDEDEGDDDGGLGGSLHHTMGYVSAGLAAATLATGYWAHKGDVGPWDGLSPANVHALLGIAGGLMMAITPLVADFGGGEAHAALGIGGELLMGIAVVWPLVF
jgi:hypothetical protein